MIKVIDPNIFKATIVTGLQKNYSNAPIKKTAGFKKLKKLHNKLIEKDKIYLSANCFKSTIVLSGQKEPHLNQQFINYPKFPLTEEVFKTYVEYIASSLKKKFKQNRLVI